MQSSEVPSLANVQESTLRFSVPTIRRQNCPNRTVKDIPVSGVFEGADQPTAQKAFEDDIEKRIEEEADLNCGDLTCTAPKFNCLFDYVIGDITASQLRARGKKTKKHNIAVAEGLWEFTTVVSVGCWCVSQA
jgi:hypothetical protein